MLFAFRELLNAREDELAEIITAEHGKVLSDALGEVARGQEVVEFACGIPHLLKGGFTENASTGVDVHSIRQPLGVGRRSSARSTSRPWCRCGSSRSPSPPATPWCSSRARRCRRRRCGWPSCGRRPACPTACSTCSTATRSPSTACSRTPTSSPSPSSGSTPIAQYVYETGTAHGKRVQALGGAKNHMVVLPDADLDLAADQAVNAGFGSAGERCMAISAVVAVGEIADELVAKIAERAVDAAHRRRPARLRHGPAGHRRRPGPGRRLHRRRRGRRREAGRGRPRRRSPTPTARASSSARPCSTTSTPTCRIYTDEIFGPVLSVVRVDTYDEALELINANPYGNGTAIFTNDGGAARRFQNEVEVGMIGINVPVPVPMAYYSFGGWKNSLFGDTHAHGTEGVHFFTRGKVVTSRWLDPSHGGINLGFPQNA